MKKTLNVIIILLIMVSSLLVCSKVYAAEDDKISAYFNIFDKNGVSQLEQAIPHNGEYYDSSLNYDDSYCEIYIASIEDNYQYEESFVVDGLGTFKFIKKETDETGGETNVYRADKIDQTLIKKGGSYDLNFRLKNLTTGNYNEVILSFSSFRDQFENDASLTVDGIDVIKNGKVINTGSYNMEAESDYDDFGCYSRVYNELYIYDVDIMNTIKFNNMGKNFCIHIWAWDKEKHKEICDISYYPYSGLKYSGDLFYDCSYINLEEITSGKAYDNAVNLLGTNYKNIQVNDISIEDFYTEEKKQLYEKIKLYIPMKNNINESKLEVYRIDDNGNKIKYDATVENDNGVNYAVFETDHLSTYVIAERIEDINPTEQPTEQSTEEPKVQQEDKKEHILDDEPKAGISATRKIVLIAILTIIGIAIIIKKLIGK